MKKILSIIALVLASNTVSAQTGILELNPRQQVLPLLLSARTAGGSWDRPAEQESVTFLHFSDLHGSCGNLERIVEFYDAYSDYIADAVHTGDAVSCYMDNVNPWTKVKGAGGIINVIGNHDCWKGHKTWSETDIPYDATAEDAYKVFIAPFVSGWKVIQPSGVDRKSSRHYCACYFYKDYGQCCCHMLPEKGRPRISTGRWPIHRIWLSLWA